MNYNWSNASSIYLPYSNVSDICFCFLMQYEDQWMIYSIFIKEKQFNNSDQSEFNFHFHSFYFSFIILLSRRELLVSLVHCIHQVYEHSSPLFVSLLISISFNFFPFSISMLFIVLELALSNRESYIFVINQRKWQASPNYQVQFSIFQFSWLFIQY